MKRLFALLLSLLLVPLASAVTVTPSSDVSFFTLDNVAANNTDLIQVNIIRHEGVQIQLTGTWVATVSFQGSVDGTTWVAALAYPIGTVNGAPVTEATANGSWTIPINAPYVRARVTAYTSGSVAGSAVVRLTSPPLPVGLVSLGATTTHHAISAATTNATSVKASAGTVNHIVVNNLNAAVRYFKLYNKASAPTVGTDTPVLTLAIPAASVQSIDLGSRGLRLSTGIAYALTAGIAVADVAAVAAAEHAVHISYE